MNKDLVYEFVEKIPWGKVATYGQIARLAQLKSARTVGYYLHHNPDPVNVPCHRVVNSKGEVAQSFAFGGGRIQRQKLEEEGIVFINNKIDLKKYQWKG